VTSKRFKIGTLLLTILLLYMVFMPAVSAMPGTQKNQTEEVGFFSGTEMPEELKKNIVQVDPYTFVFKGKVDDKKKFVAAWNEYEAKAKNKGITLQYVTREDSGSASATRNLLGSYIEGQSYFHGARTDYVISQEFIGDGNTKGYWWGLNPYYADLITLASSVKLTGISVSISVPAGIGFSTSGDTATYSGTWSDAWSAQHYYSNLDGTGLSIFDEDQNDAETFRFSGTDYTLYTHVDLDA